MIGAAGREIPAVLTQNVTRPSSVAGSSRFDGGTAADEQPLSLEDALIAYVGRQGDKGFFLNPPGGAQ